MKLTKVSAAIAALTILASSCQDNLSTIGSSLVKGEVTITMDSIVTDVNAVPEYLSEIDGRSFTKLLGRLAVPEYGTLDCSFVTQLLCSNGMNVPDSIKAEDIDSVSLRLVVPRGALTGDSLAPQQLRLYRLEKQLPSDITSAFDPTGYYDPSSPWGVKSYTLSMIASGDSASKKSRYLSLPVTLPIEWGRDIFNRYRSNDPIFQWPSTFNEFFPGLYVECNFGNGCVANISRAEIFTYWHRTTQVYQLNSEGQYEYVDKVVPDSVCLMSTNPIVLSSNNIRYSPSDRITTLAGTGHPVVTSPGGYIVNIRFPVKELLEGYLAQGDGMAVVSGLQFEIPATTIANNHGIDVAPYLLMVPRAKREEFFANNSVPDNQTSFYAAYNRSTGSYQFTSMRGYFLDLYKRYAAGETIPEDEIVFTLMPVSVSTEVVEGYNSSTTYVTGCTPYMDKPTMTMLAADRALICFTYSNQAID